MMVLVCLWLVWCEIGLLDGCGVININGWLVDVDWFIWNGLNVVNVWVGYISFKGIGWAGSWGMVVGSICIGSICIWVSV